MSSSNCCFLTCIQIFQEAGQVVWYSHLFKNFLQFVVIYIVKGFGMVTKAEIDVILELSCFIHDPADVGNLISSSSAFSKTSLNIWKFTNSCTVETWLGEFWALLYSHVRWVQLCSSLNILWHCLSLGLEWKLTYMFKNFISDILNTKAVHYELSANIYNAYPIISETDFQIKLKWINSQ